jgi:DNA-binding MarR family transcriptional regulator
MGVPEDISATDPFDDLLGYHLRRASVAVMADLTAALAPLGLKPVEASVLFVIAAGGGVTQAQIGRVLGIQRANMAPLMARLMKEKLVVREKMDGRSQALRLSLWGRAMHGRAMAATQAHEGRMFGAVPQADRAKMIKQLRGLWLTAEG